MARLLENTAKEYLRREKLPVPSGYMARTPQEAERIATDLGGAVMIKALVPVGKRDTAGAIQVAATPTEAFEQAAKILRTQVQGFPVNCVLVETRVAVVQELYFGLLLDGNACCPLAISGDQGGTGVENDQGKLVKRHLNPEFGLREYEAREMWAELGFTGQVLNRLASISNRLWKQFVVLDAYFLEINPLAVTESGEIMILDIRANLDDDALFRHPALAGEIDAGSEKVWRPLTELELEQGKKVGRRRANEG